MARLVSLSVLIAAIAGLGIMFFQVIAPFLLPLFLAAVAAVLLSPWYQKMRGRLEGRARLAAGITTLLTMLLFLLPLSTGVLVAGLQAYSFSTELTPAEIRSMQEKGIDWIAKFVAPRSSWLPSGLQPPSKDQIPHLIESNDARIDELQGIMSSGSLSLADRTEATQQIRYLQAQNNRLDSLTLTEEGKVQYFRSALQDNMVRLRQSLDGQLFGVASKTVGGTLGIVGQTLGAVLGAVLTLFVFGVALYYFLADGPALISGAEKLIPVHVNYQRELLTEFAKVVRSVVLATFVAAAAQGIATTGALALLGFDHLILLLIVSVVASLIPLAGTWLVWVPCAFILVAKGHFVSAIVLTIWGGAVVGTMDNVIRAYVLNNDTKLHPLLALLAVLGGLQVMGIWGVFIGPIVASCLHALVKIFNHELMELSHEKFGESLVGITVNAAESPPQTDGDSESRSGDQQRPSEANQADDQSNTATTSNRPSEASKPTSDAPSTRKQQPSKAGKSSKSRRRRR